MNNKPRCRECTLLYKGCPVPDVDIKTLRAKGCDHFSPWVLPHDEIDSLIEGAEEVCSQIKTILREVQKRENSLNPALVSEVFQSVTKHNSNALTYIASISKALDER